MLGGLPGCAAGGGRYEFRDCRNVRQGHTPRWNSEALIDLSYTKAPNKAGIAGVAQL